MLRSGSVDVGIAGTFDVENYGDLLFPLIAAEALQVGARRSLTPFSPHARRVPDWPFDVQASINLKAYAPELAALLLGGGQLLRFDDAYPIAAACNMRLPDAYWLDPGLEAVAAGVPVIWNAVGAWTGTPRSPSGQAKLAHIIDNSAILAVRDEVSRAFLNRLFPAAPIEVVPDTAFSLSKFWQMKAPSAEYSKWRAARPLDGGYVVVQADHTIARSLRRVEDLIEQIGRPAVLLPICRCHGDDEALFDSSHNKWAGAGGWLHPLLITEIIANAEMVVATSLHACITGLSYGVPTLRLPHSRDRKFELLSGFEGIGRFDRRYEVLRLLKRGKGIDLKVAAHQGLLEDYWHRVRAIADGYEHTAPATPSVELDSARKTNFKDWLASLFPPRLHQPRVPGRPSQLPTERLLKIGRICNDGMRTTPYRWGRFDKIFTETDGQMLAQQFPIDRYREVTGYDGEKSYRYAARSLIHMGASVPTALASLSRAWLALALDLLSDEYRQSVAAASGLDLSRAPMEVNVIQYGPGAWLGPHIDLSEKILTHILYFNEVWDQSWGGCLQILGQDGKTSIEQIPPLVGSSALLVRSEASWHAVSNVAPECRRTRKSLNVIFHLPGSTSTMWPPGSKPPLKTVRPLEVLDQIA